MEVNSFHVLCMNMFWVAKGLVQGSTNPSPGTRCGPCPTFGPLGASDAADQTWLELWRWGGGMEVNLSVCCISVLCLGALGLGNLSPFIHYIPSLIHLVLKKFSGPQHCARYFLWPFCRKVWRHLERSFKSWDTLLLYMPNGSYHHQCTWLLPRQPHRALLCPRVQRDLF